MLGTDIQCLPLSLIPMFTVYLYRIDSIEFYNCYIFLDDVSLFLFCNKAFSVCAASLDSAEKKQSFIQSSGKCRSEWLPFYVLNHQTFLSLLKWTLKIVDDRSVRNSKGILTSQNVLSRQNNYLYISTMNSFPPIRGSFSSSKALAILTVPDLVTVPINIIYYHVASNSQLMFSTLIRYIRNPNWRKEESS